MITTLYYQEKVKREWIERVLTISFENADSFDFLCHKNDERLLRMHLDFLTQRFPGKEMRIIKVIIPTNIFSFN